MPTRRDLLLNRRELPRSLQYTPERLRKLMASSGLSNGDAAEALEVSKKSIERWAAPRDRSYSREMPAPMWELFLLVTDNHPHLFLMPKVGAEGDD